VHSISGSGCSVTKRPIGPDDIFTFYRTSYNRGMSPEVIDQIVATLRRWVNAQAPLRALAIVGSRARGDARPDSDLDVLVFTNDMTWASSVEWLRDPKLGLTEQTITSAQREVHGIARSWRMLLGAAEVDLTFADTSWANTSPIDCGTWRVLSDGIKVLVDKDGLLMALTKSRDAVMHRP
jgi:hypothetical protein